MKISSIELQLDLRILYLSIIHQYTNFRPNYRSEGGAMMDLKAVGQRIKAAREAKNLTQEELAALVNLSTTHVSVIERGLKVTKLDTFVAIANGIEDVGKYTQDGGVVAKYYGVLTVYQNEDKGGWQ